MQKWQYCIITGLGRSVKGVSTKKGTINSGASTDRAVLCLLTSKGQEMIRDFDFRLRGVSEEDAVAHAMAQLGEDGWELVAAGSTDTVRHTLYFKRPVE